MSTPTDRGSPNTPQGGPRRPRQGRGGAGCLIVLVLLGGLMYWLFGVNHETNYAASPANTATTSPDNSGDTSTDAPDDSSTGTDDAIEAGDCLSVQGPQPTSTGTVDVSDITQVDCGSSAAQYKVVGVEPFTTDMNSCSTDYQQSTAALLDQGPYFSEVYCVVDASS